MATTTETAAQFWERHHRAHPPAERPRVNPLLSEVAADLGPGVALDLGCGGGGDALWLAERGWRVTAVDISATAVARLAATAERLGLSDRITGQRHDLSRSFPPGAFELVSAQYLQSPVQLDRAAILRTAAAALVPGGRMLIVDHGSVAPWSWNRDRPTRFPTPLELAADLDLDPDEWRLERADAPRRWADGPDGQRAEVVDTVILLGRLDRTGGPR